MKEINLTKLELLNLISLIKVEVAHLEKISIVHPCLVVWSHGR